MIEVVHRMDDTIKRVCFQSYFIFLSYFFFFSILPGYTMLDQLVWLVVIETLEPLCSLWMLVTASERIEELECRKRVVGVDGDRWHSWKVNTWALIILFHYTLGTYRLLHFRRVTIK